MRICLESVKTAADSESNKNMQMKSDEALLFPAAGAVNVFFFFFRQEWKGSVRCHAHYSSSFVVVVLDMVLGEKIKKTICSNSDKHNLRIISSE